MEFLMYVAALKGIPKKIAKKRAKELLEVVGGGDSALQETLYLSNLCEKVYLIHRREEFKVAGSLLDKVQEKDNVVRIMNTNITELGMEDNKLTSVLLDSGDELEVDGLFVYVGFVPGTKFAEDLEITDENGIY